MRKFMRSSWSIRRNTVFSMDYLEYLKKSASERKSIVCFGIDPVIENIPASLGDSTQERIVNFYAQIVDGALQRSPSIAALKPNYAYFAQYGFEGLQALYTIIKKYRGVLPIIFDGKRGDIGPSSAAYAKEAFEFWGADALTISPYMGEDSMMPFVKYASANGKGVYVLVRTSNPGAADFQELKTDARDKPVYLEVARKLMKMHFNGLGAVVGATDVDDLERVMWELEHHEKVFPLLVPGVGTQGGSAKEVAKTLKTVSAQTFQLHRINSSSAIAFAYKKTGSEDFVGAALAQIDALNREINLA